MRCKTVLRRKCIATRRVKKDLKSSNYNLRYQKKNELNPKLGEEIMKMRAQIDETEQKCNREKSLKPKDIPCKWKPNESWSSYIWQNRL